MQRRVLNRGTCGKRGITVPVGATKRRWIKRFDVASVERKTFLFLDKRYLEIRIRMKRTRPRRSRRKSRRGNTGDCTFHRRTCQGGKSDI
jgi:hypothetical protein